MPTDAPTHEAPAFEGGVVPADAPTHEVPEYNTYVNAATAHAAVALGVAAALDSVLGNDDSDLAEALKLGGNERKAAIGVQSLPLFNGEMARLIVDGNERATAAIYDKEIERKRGIWAKILGGERTLDGNADRLGFKANDYGVIVGADTVLGNGNVGVALGHTRTDVDSKGLANHTAKANTTTALIYGDYDTGSTTASGHIGASFGNVEGERHITWTGANTVAKSDYDTKGILAGFGLSHRIGSTDKHIAPYAKVSYQKLTSDAYRESDASLFSLDVAKQDFESLKFSAGVAGKLPLTDKLGLTAKIGGGYDAGDNFGYISGSFVGTDGSNFTTGQKVSREFAEAGVGLAYKPSQNSQLSLGYQGGWRSGYQEHGGAVVWQMKF
ncbi:Extracellular serine protease precursor [Moraxella caviae]|nr:Extracellular serine protease precursor [Moraxella caviae]